MKKQINPKEERMQRIEQSRLENAKQKETEIRIYSEEKDYFKLIAKPKYWQDENADGKEKKIKFSPKKNSTQAHCRDMFDQFKSNLEKIQSNELRISLTNDPEIEIREKILAQFQPIAKTQKQVQRTMLKDLGNMIELGYTIDREAVKKQLEITKKTLEHERKRKRKES